MNTRMTEPKKRKTKMNPEIPIPSDLTEQIPKVDGAVENIDDVIKVSKEQNNQPPPACPNCTQFPHYRHSECNDRCGCYRGCGCGCDVHFSQMNRAQARERNDEKEASKRARS